MFRGLYILILFVLALNINLYETQYTCKINNNTYEIMKIPDEKFKQLEYYKISFNKTLVLPNYTLYLFNILVHRCPSNKFHQDLELQSRTHDSFTNTGMDRGHLVPAADVNDSCSTFNMANVAPNIPCFNQRIWNNLEKYVRNNFMNKNILTAPEYDYSKFIIDNHGEKLYVPIGLYKVIFDDKTNNKILYSIYLSHTNENCDKDFNDVGDFTKLPYFIKAKF